MRQTSKQVLPRSDKLLQGVHRGDTRSGSHPSLFGDVVQAGICARAGEGLPGEFQNALGLTDSVEMRVPDRSDYSD